MNYGILRQLAQSAGIPQAVERMIVYHQDQQPSSALRYWAAVNFDLHSSKPRLFLFDLVKNKFTSHLCAHGKGSEGDKDDGYATIFSNKDGSNCTSLGIYRCETIYYSGKNGKSLYLDGLEASNSNARHRHIVMHGAKYVSDAYIQSTGRIGRSFGCPAIEKDKVELILNALKGGSLLILWKSKNDNHHVTPEFIAPPHQAALDHLRNIKTRVKNRGVIPDSFLQEMVDWAKTAPDEIFEHNDKPDIYSSVIRELGPWESLLHRKAVMLEVLRVLAGFESSWDWNAGIDVSNPSSVNPVRTEAGAWQVSADSMAWGDDLRDLVKQRAHATDPITFQNAMKTDHHLATEYAARLLRHTVKHHGPVKNRKIHEWLRREAVAEWTALLTV